MPGFVPGIHVLPRMREEKNVDGRDIGEPPGLAFGKPKGELRDAVLRTAMPGYDGGGRSGKALG
jgi:hypothetical protein